MGYTHYWRHDGALDPTTWTAFTDDVRKIINLTSVSINNDDGGAPEVTEQLVYLNGDGEDGYETFLFYRQGSGFAFCKTARKPYDEVVTAILILVGEHFPEVRVSSDGDWDDWTSGAKLYLRALERIPVCPLT